jgi:hypothetical protein
MLNQFLTSVTLQKRHTLMRKHQYMPNRSQPTEEVSMAKTHFSHRNSLFQAHRQGINSYVYQRFMGSAYAN